MRRVLIAVLAAAAIFSAAGLCRADPLLTIVFTGNTFGAKWPCPT
ncbi:MAG: hypothetical protein PHV85_11845 [Desulfovibrionaceae bacterium]|nr:hypothetical protein [Desulfovibrionaceae bacterium]